MTKAKKSKKLLPDKHPRKSGRRGIGPKLEPSDESTASLSMEQQEAAIEEAGGQLESAESETETRQKGKQKELLKVPKQPTPAVKNNRMAAHFIGFAPKRTKNRDRVVVMRFSLELEEEHSGRIPELIETEWKHFLRNKIKAVIQNEIPSQNVELSIAPDSKVDLDIVCSVPKAIISKVSQKGKGATRKVIRLEIHFLTAYSKDVEHFCHDSYDELIWLGVQESQTSFSMENDEE